MVSTKQTMVSTEQAIVSRKIHVGLCSIPCYGHVKPLFLFAEQLAEGGHEVTFYTSSSMVKYCEGIGQGGRIAIVGLEDGLIPESEDFFLGKPPGLNVPVLSYAMNCMGEPLKMAVEARTQPLDIMISDHLSWAGSYAAIKLSIQHAVHVTWPLAMVEETRVIPPSTMSTALGIRWRDFRGGWIVPRIFHPSGPPRAMLRRVREHCSGGLVLVATHFGLDYPRLLPPTVKVVGRAGKPETVKGLSGHPDLQDFLARNNVVVLVTFGSRVPPPKERVEAVAKGLLAGGWAVVWSCKAAQQGYLPEAVQESNLFFVREWIPQGAVLAHPNVLAAVTHCGMGGMWECAVNGVSIIPLPFLLSADQPLNARAAQHAGYASIPAPRGWLGWLRGAPSLAEKAVEEAVRKALTDPAVARSAERAKLAALGAAHGNAGVQYVEAACLYGTAHLQVQDKGAFKSTARLVATLSVITTAAATVMLAYAGSSRSRKEI
ncbi:unnamed protein product [Discosporangium mesarthrocarpum]